MNELIQAAVKRSAREPVRDSNRFLVLVVLLWCANQISDVKHRVVVIESRLNAAAVLKTNQVNGFAQNTIGPVKRGSHGN